MKGITLLVIALTLAQVFVNGAEDAPYNMPWWAAMYPPEQVKALVDTETLAAAPAVGAPEATATTDPVYLGYQGGGMGTVMLETGAHAEAMEDILLEQQLESLIAMDSMLDSEATAEAKYIPTLEIFPPEENPIPVPRFQKGWKFRTASSVPNSKIVDDVLLGGEVEYSFSKMPKDGNTLLKAESLIKTEDSNMDTLKAQINDFEHFYWNNGGRHIPQHIMGGSFLESTQNADTEVDADAEVDADVEASANLDEMLLSELEAELDNEGIEDKLEEEGIAQANAEDEAEMQSFLAQQEEATEEADEEEEMEETEEEAQPQQEQEQSFVATETTYLPTVSRDMVPIPPRVQEILDAKFKNTNQTMYHPIPVVMVKTIGGPFVPNGGMFEAQVGPSSATVADNLIIKGAEKPQDLQLGNNLLWHANNATIYAGEVLKASREVVNKPFVDVLSHGIVEADLKPKIIYDTVNGTVVANFAPQ